MTRANLIVPRAALLLLALPLAACSGGGSTEAAGSLSSAVSPSAPATTSATSSAAPSALSSSSVAPSASPEAGTVQDPDVQKDCLVAGLTYMQLKAGLAGSDADLVAALQSASPPDFKEVGRTKQGKAAEAALAALGSEVAAQQGAAATGNTPDRAGLQKAYTAASTACAPLAAPF